MKRTLSILFAFLILTGLSFAQTGNEELKEIALLLKDKSTRTATLESLNPSMDDLQKIFLTKEDVNDAWIHLQYYYVDIESIDISPNEALKEILIKQISGAELSSKVEGSISEKYFSLGGHVKDDVFMYVVEFVFPGEEFGYATGAFFHVREHWVFIPDAFDIFID